MFQVFMNMFGIKIIFNDIISRCGNDAVYIIGEHNSLMYFTISTSQLYFARTSRKETKWMGTGMEMLFFV